MAPRSEQPGSSPPDTLSLSPLTSPTVITGSYANSNSSSLKSKPRHISSSDFVSTSRAAPHPRGCQKIPGSLTNNNDTQQMYSVDCSGPTSQEHVVACTDPRRTQIHDPDARHIEMNPVENDWCSIQLAPPLNPTSYAQSATSQTILDTPSYSSNTIRLTSEPSVSTFQNTINEAVDASLSYLGNNNLDIVIDLSNLRQCRLDSTTEGGRNFIYKGVLDGVDVCIKVPKIAMSHTKDKIYALVQDIAHEARALRSCDHSNIQSLIGVAPFEDSLALISPWMQQGDLSKLIYQPDSGLSSKDRYTLSIQIADSVSYLHNLNILHVDIKSSNILLSSDLKPKLADFGSAMMNEVSTEHRNIVASLHWAPPEFAMRRQPSPGWDVHSLGMTIFEIFAGCMPYDGIQRNTVQAHIILRKLPRRPQNRLPVGDRQSDRLWELLLKCWAQDPLCRPTASEVRDELKLISEIAC